MNELIDCKFNSPEYHLYFKDIDLKDDEAHFIQGIVLLKDGLYAGRIALFHNPQVHYLNYPVLMGGYFDCIQDATLAGTLLYEAERIAKTAALEYFLLPVNGSTWNDYRLPLTGDKPLFLGDNDQPLYYATLMQQNGFEVMQKYYSFKAILPEETSKLSEIEDQLLQDGIVVRNLSETHFMDELKLLYPVCNEAFSGNPLFAPISFEGFVNRYLPIKNILDFDHSLLAFDADNCLLAFMICYRDLLDVSGATLILKTIAKNPKNNIPGLMSKMGELLYAKAKLSNYTNIIHAMMHEANPSLKRSKEFGGEILRTYGLFGKQV